MKLFSLLEMTLEVVKLLRFISLSSYLYVLSQY